MFKMRYVNTFTLKVLPCLLIVSNALDETQLRHILELNLNPNIKQSIPHPDQNSAIIEPPEQCRNCPDSAQTWMSLH